MAKLPGLLLSLHTLAQASAGISPAYAMFHRKLRIPITMQIPGTMDLTNPTLTLLASNTRLVDDFIRDKTEQSFQRASKFDDRSAIVPRYKDEDQVLLYNKHVGIGEMCKIHRFYRLTVKVTACLENYCYMVQDCTPGQVIRFNVA